MEFDYIVVGSGAGGSVVAERLSADPAVSVLVVEGGGSDRHPIHLVPKGFFFTMQSPKYTKKFTVQPYGPQNSVDQWFRGRVIGGSTTVNGLIWNRGWAPDFDMLEAQGNTGWNWQTFLSAYLDIERFQSGPSAIHGGAGPVNVEIGRPAEAVSEAFMASCVTAGMTKVDDVNGSDLERTGYTQFSTKRGTRVSASRAFLHPALRRSNLRLLTDAEVGQVLFSGRRATGVRVHHRGETADITARREVILCAGALDTPLLLERSGIGQGAVLSANGIQQIVESPNVGERLSEHRGARFMYRLRRRGGYNHQVDSQLGQLTSGARYLFTRDGIISQGSANVLAYFTSEPGAQRPDSIGFFNPISTKNTSLHDKALVVDDKPGLMIAVYPLRPTSRGSIHLGSDGPVIRPNYLSTEYDQQMIRNMSTRTEELFAKGPVSDLVGERLYPGPEIATEDEFLHNSLVAGASGYHTLATCAMGPNDDDVVDPQLRVRGVEALRVVDASVFPYQPSGNTSAPTQALAWHAASLIQAAHS
ncbi:GMC family oxidoreductase [Nocardia alni]|uniref:GMC family oxidoreductase n=1 Tax=Nocardia alni TaxID=2815723 RepID=UPI001C23F157|nr:GMC family oxidoreductase N-terminal domain-containing protein [Nocardia alni]